MKSREELLKAIRRAPGLTKEDYEYVVYLYKHSFWASVTGLGGDVIRLSPDDMELAVTGSFVSEEERGIRWDYWFAPVQDAIDSTKLKISTAHEFSLNIIHLLLYYPDAEFVRKDGGLIDVI